MNILFIILFQLLKGLSAIFESIISFFRNNIKIILTTIIILSYVIPIAISMESGWELPELLLVYYFVAAIFLLIMLMGAAIDDRYYRNDYNEYINNSNANTQYKQKIHYPYISPEKRRNGGLSDAEVKIKKEQIRKKLEEKNMI